MMTTMRRLGAGDYPVHGFRLIEVTRRLFCLIEDRTFWTADLPE